MLLSRPALFFLLACWVFAIPADALAQTGDNYDPSWYNADSPYIRIAVTADGVYRLDAGTLTDALPDGTALADISPETIRLIENGREIPLQLDGTADGSLDTTDTITFVGQRNRGSDELWAYNGDSTAQSSPYHSLYSDTTFYWMTWGGTVGDRYQTSSPAATSPTTALRDTVHAEQDNRYYFGRPNENGNSLYTSSEGYYWTRFSHNDTSPITFSHTLPVGRRTNSTTELDLSVRLDAATNSCHRVELEGNLLQSDGSTAFESIGSVEWQGYDRRTVDASIPQDRVPETGLEIRLTSYNDTFSDDNCPDPSSTPNYVLLDWIEAAYTRTLEAHNERQRFVSPTAEKSTFSISGYSGTTVYVYNEEDGSRYEVPVTNGTATVTDDPNTAPTPYWAVGDGGFRDPVAILSDTPSDWAHSSNAADYVILTTEALLPAAQKLADYRASSGGYDVEIALVQNVFDEFDYGRPTPIAIRRFVRATQNWDTAPRFLTIFADAQYPIRDGSVDTLYPEWSVPAFGYAPSDGWYAMQTDGPEDWSETLAIGRIPVRSVAQGDLFVEKLKDYESAPLERWQKRMLLLAGGTSESEQQSLQFYSNRWGEIASDTVATINGEETPVHTGMDTLRYYKNVSDALDNSFQDSLAADLERGTGWLNYFGHSAAQTWEIVTDPPSEFDNAGRLPVVVSLGCRTGSFAGGRFEEKSAPSLGEQLVVGSVRSDGTPRDGTLNGGIAHFGESALGNRLPSARLNDALIQRVFVDTMRVLGDAIRTAKADVADNYGSSSLYAKHLLQYGLLGDPATRMALPEKPDLHVTSNLISTSPTAPTPSDELNVSVRIENRGMIPSDTVNVHLTWEKPNGTTTQRSRRIQRMRLERTLEFSFSLDQESTGGNTFRVDIDPNNVYAEVNESNNTAEQTQTVFDTGVSLISPVNFGIAPTQRPSLKFSVYRQTAEPVSVVAQLDSVPDFSSPFRQEVRKQVNGLLGSWRPTILEPNTTYYWRARTASSDQSEWRRSRFTVQTNTLNAGWLQQSRLFRNNNQERMNWTRQSGWTFDDFTRDILISSESGNGGFKGVISIDGTERYENRTLGFGIVIIDGKSGKVKKNESFCTYDVSDDILNERRCGGGVDGSEATDLLEKFLTSVEAGDHVLVRTRHLARSGSVTISDRVKSLFRTLGGDHSPHSTAIDTLNYADLWLMRAKKGTPDSTIERVTDDTNEITHRSPLSFNYASGRTTTAEIGPASSWDSLRWKATGAASANVEVDILAADTNQVLRTVGGMNGSLSLDFVDPSVHPYLRLRATLTDSTTRTSPQLKQWSVLHEGVPELAVDPLGLQSLRDTLRQGQDGAVSLPVVNLGPVSSAPIRVRYTVTDGSNVTRSLSTDTLTALSPGARDTSSIRIPTEDLPGSNVITGAAENDGPPERLTNNNTAVRNFYVQRDGTPPSLEILSNGRTLPPTPSHVDNLQDPELPFVSTEPSFKILLRDDNPHLSLDDTSHAEVYLKGGLPNRDPSLISEFRRIPFSSQKLRLVPSDSGDGGSMQILFEPSLQSEKDSTYTMKVEAQDTQGNKVEPYQTSFRIQQNQVIRDVYPYPNPMSSHTTFAFRVEGGQDNLLRNFSLRIYTVSGRLVRELTQKDLDNPLSVGWNTARWNGRDADGDLVATGLYLYRVEVKGAQETFQGEVEKIAVIR